MKHPIILAAVYFSFAALLSRPAQAQLTNSQENAARLQDPGAMDTPGWNASVNTSYVAPTTTRFLGTHLARSDAYTVSLGAGAQVDLNEKWFTHFGLGLDNIFLGTASGAPLPASIHTLHFNLDLGCRINDQWSVSGFLFPAIYRLDRVDGEDIGFAGGFLGTYKPKRSLILTFGIMAAPDSDFKVLPVGGVRWFINDHSLLEAGFPRTRYSYRFDPHWTLYAGGDFAGTTFRTSDTLGAQNGGTQYNHALATYRDARIGAGVACRICRGIRLEAEGGCSIYRRIDYTRIEQNVEFDPAPYARVGLFCRF